VVMMWY